MNGDLVVAVAAELLKVRRSKVIAGTFGAFGFAACVGAVFMVVLRDPDKAARAGTVGQKAQASNLTADWPGMVGFLGQAVAVGGLVVFAFVATWMFGREYADGTVRYLLALPVSRTTVVVAKLLVTVAWCFALTAWLVGAGMALGAVLALPGWDTGVVVQALGRVVLAASLMIIVIAPIPLIASIGRGYLAPVAAALAALVVAQLAAALGAGGVVPWAIPAVAVGLVPDATLTPIGWGAVSVTGVAGVAATIAWWNGADTGL